MVIGPKGEPPAGGSKIPLMWKVGRSPPGTSSWNGEPSVRWCFFAKSLSVNASRGPSVSKTACEPCFQSSLKIWLPPGSTAESWCFDPKARISPERTPTTLWTPAAWCSVLSIAVGIRS
jgi:hypothetical protein